ncbi:hypothetical protein COO60DRAFT_1513000 [Scenedesmus sp. NREL 46B-D3]|nr:hypothetical protein COO60DRAFT_1513000 [Scenedesmus sp. NREL 46B-D3]
MVRRRKTGEVLASRAWKEAQLGKQAGPSLITACVRVRFPEGVCLQGRFHTSEPLSSLFAWVTDSLTNPATTYELIGPDRKPLTPAGHVAGAQLAPAVLLNFRPLGQQGQPVDAAGRQLSFLKDELLQQAHAD